MTLCDFQWTLKNNNVSIIENIYKNFDKWMYYEGMLKFRGYKIADYLVICRRTYNLKKKNEKHATSSSFRFIFEFLLM